MHVVESVRIPANTAFAVAVVGVSFGYLRYCSIMVTWMPDVRYCSIHSTVHCTLYRTVKDDCPSKQQVSTLSLSFVCWNAKPRQAHTRRETTGTVHHARRLPHQNNIQYV
jgi:hypothetical protein